MKNGVLPLVRVAATTAMLLFGSCGGGGAATTVVETTVPPTTAAPTATTKQPPTTDSSSGACEEPATEIALDSATSLEIIGSEQPPGESRYFCVLVPDGVSGITFELTGMTADLNLYVGHPDFETLQQGGLWFWYSEEAGTDEEAVVVEPVAADYVNPGPYYIEVVGEDFRESSPFTLSVRTQ